MVIISQYSHIVNCYVVHLKLICQLYHNFQKNEKNKYINMEQGDIKKMNMASR